MVRLNNSVCVHRFRVQRSGFPGEIGIQGYLSVCESDADEPFADFLICRQVVDMLAMLCSTRRAGLRARALTRVCSFNHALNSPHNLFFPDILWSRMAGGFSVNPEPVNRYNWFGGVCYEALVS